MGHAVILPNMDFSNSGMGKVTIPTPPVALVSLSIVAEDSYSGSSTDSFNLSVTYNPANTTQTGVTWSIDSGSSYASITSGGVLSIISGADSDEVVVKATSTVNSSIYATKTITVTYVALDLWSIANADSDIAPYLTNATKTYELASEVTMTGSESTGTLVSPNPVNSLSSNYFVLFDVTFGTGNGSRTSSCLFARLADNANFHKAPSDSQSQYQTEWAFRSRWSGDYTGERIPGAMSDCFDGNRYKVFMCFNRTTGTLFLKNITTGKTSTVEGEHGNGTIRDGVYLYGGTVPDNAFDGTIHEFIIGTY